MKLVLDTDVVRSGLQSPGGASRLLLCAIAEGAFVPLVTVAIVLEYEDVLMRSETCLATGLEAAQVGAFLDSFLRYSQRVVVSSRFRPRIQDPADEIFVEALENGGGDAIVTFNRRDYLHVDHKLASRGVTAVPVMAPGETLRRLAWRPTAITPFVFPPR